MNVYADCLEQTGRDRCGYTPAELEGMIVLKPPSSDETEQDGHASDSDSENNSDSDDDEFQPRPPSKVYDAFTANVRAIQTAVEAASCMIRLRTVVSEIKQPSHRPSSVAAAET